MAATEPPLEPARASYGYLPALDGFRGLSILLVVVSHADLPIVPGTLGVIVFFAISGFLLTRQMIVEIERTGTLRLRDFYLRRVFRLAPALLAYIALFTAILLPLGSMITPVHVLSGIFYFANYYDTMVGYPMFSPFPIVWSLSVEEHYYIVFPFCMLLFRKRLSAIMPWLGLAFAAALAWRATLFYGCTADPAWGPCSTPASMDEHGIAFGRTDTSFDCILYGALFALGLHYRTAALRRLFINRTAFALGLAGIALSLALRDAAFRDIYRYALESVSASVIIVNVLFGDLNLIRRLVSLPLLLFVGRLSYSLYLFHFGVLMTLEALHKVGPPLQGRTDYIIYFVASFALAACSYYLVEKPMVAVRRRFGSHRLSA